MKRDDVRSSLDLLDSVIGEFDDGGGLTSGAESEAPADFVAVPNKAAKENHVKAAVGNRHHRRHKTEDVSSSQVTTSGQKRRETPVKGKTWVPHDSVTSNGRRENNGDLARSKQKQAVVDEINLSRKSSSNTSSKGQRLLSERIEDIFSEATHELVASNSSSDRRNGRDRGQGEGQAHAVRSPMRRVDDPLPTPPPPPPPPLPPTSQPQLPKQPQSLAEVVVYGEEDLKTPPQVTITNVRAQIHSLEARGREEAAAAAATAAAAAAAKRTHAKSRSRSENPPAVRRLPPNGSPEIPSSSSSSSSSSSAAISVDPAPPPMPEKTRIHLKSLERQNAVFVSENESQSPRRGRGRGRPPNRTQSSKVVPSSSTPFYPAMADGGGGGGGHVGRRSASPERRSSNNSRHGRRHHFSKYFHSPERQPHQKRSSATSKASPASSLSSGNPYEIVSRFSGSSGGVGQHRSRRQEAPSGNQLQYKRSRSLSALEANGQSNEAVFFHHHHQQQQQQQQQQQSQKSNKKREEKSGKSRHKGSSGSRDRGRSLERGALGVGGEPGRTHHPHLSKERSMERLLPRLNSVTGGRAPMRQKSMIDLRDPPPLQLQQHHFQEQIHARHHQVPHPPVPALVRAATEHDIKHKRRSMPPLEQRPSDLDELPPLLRRQMMHEQAAAVAAVAAAATGHPLAAAADPLLLRQITLEAQREVLLRRGAAAFSPNHPFISGEVPIHPELQGRLPFRTSGPNRTIPLRPEDYARFKPEFWLPHHNPSPVTFADVSLLHSELELRRRRDLHRQASQKQRVVADSNDGGSGSGGGISSDNFQSMPWEDIIVNNESGLVEGNNNNNNKRHITSWGDQSRLRRQQQYQQVLLGGAKQSGHWLLKEKDLAVNHHQHQSMPPHVDTLRDSGIGEEKHHQRSSGGKSTNPDHISRGGTGRSSFGIILKDKFQKNPNMYFPAGQTNLRRADDDDEDDNNSSDTDTLIHNMSEGSFEKESSSAASSAATTASSMSPHNSMEGSPRMSLQQQQHHQMKAQQHQQQQPQQPVSLNKKTIRNYTPKQSGDLLSKELEGRRKISKTGQNYQESRTTPVEKMIADFHRNLPPVEGHHTRSKSPEQSIEQQRVVKAVVEPRREERQVAAAAATTSRRQSNREEEDDNTVGTLNSQVSNWSGGGASSVASFDYQPFRNSNNSTRFAGHHHHQHHLSDQLAVLEESHHSHHRHGQHHPGSRGVRTSPDGERLPPEGASAEAPSPAPPAHSFVQRIEVKAEVNSDRSVMSSSRERKVNRQSEKRKTFGGEDLSDLLTKAAENDEEEDEFSNLRKLISEGRITGLNEKPPSFVPPTPPATAKPTAVVNRRRSSSKPPAPKPKQITPQDEDDGDRIHGKHGRESPTPTSHHHHTRRDTAAAESGQNSLEKRPSRATRKTKETAPQPPKVSGGKGGKNNDLKVTSPRLRESLEDLTHMDVRRAASHSNGNAVIKRSPSNHETKTRYERRREENLQMAQLIADSTEKKFNFNPFKGMWKKKHYSFDFN